MVSVAIANHVPQCSLACLIFCHVLAHNTVMTSASVLRAACPPALCDCGRDALLGEPSSAQARVLLLTKPEETRLLQRLEAITSLEDLRHMQRRLFEQLGIRLTVQPGASEVRSMRGFEIRVAEQPGLCRKTRQSIPAAVRRSLQRTPEIAYRLLDEHDLFGL